MPAHLSAHPSLSIPARVAFQLQLTPFNSTPQVRRAQDAVINARPFSESLVKVLFAINTRLAGEDVVVPLCDVRPVKTVLLLVCTGDRGLCGGFNNFIIKKAEQRVAELKSQVRSYKSFSPIARFQHLIASPFN